MDRIQATPRVNPAIGGLADMLGGTLDYLRSPQRTQQMQGLINALPFLDDAQVLLDRISYGEPITTGRGMTTELRPEAKSTLGAMLGLVPIGRAAAPAAEAATMAAGRAGERVAERVVPRVMERGGLPAEMLGAMAQGTQSPATVFHGTPHLFNKFDSSKIGAGEGNQAYGYGLYLAESPDVAESYKRPMSSEFLWRDLDAVLPNALKGKAPDWTDALLSGKTVDDLASTLKRPWEKSLLQQNKAKIQAVIDAHNTQGNLMQVDLPDEQIARMLDYDKPLSEQPKNVQDAIKAYAKELDVPLSVFESGPLGPTVTRAAMEPQLSQAGIPGIRYLDQGSRGAGQGTSNFVVFPGMEDMLRIEQINNQPIESLFQTLGR